MLQNRTKYTEGKFSDGGGRWSLGEGRAGVPVAVHRGPLSSRQHRAAATRGAAAWPRGGTGINQSVSQQQRQECAGWWPDPRPQTRSDDTRKQDRAGRSVSYLPLRAIKIKKDNEKAVSLT